jgi:hypothetical protein
MLAIALIPGLVLVLGDDRILYNFVKLGHVADATLLLEDDSSTGVPSALVNDTIQ